MASPFPVAGIIYDSDGTTVLANVRVSILNANTNDSAITTSNSLGEYLYDIANLTNGYSIGDEISVYASYGRYYDEIVFNVDTTGYHSENLTLETLMESAITYSSVDLVRGFTKVQASEWSDAEIGHMLQYATREIDQETGRTWKGVQIVTDEYYDGNDTDTLFLNHPDIVSVTSIAIDDSQSGTYTTVDTDPYVYSEGYIILNRNGNRTVFTANPKSVKMSYTWGNASPTPEVRELCNLMVANLIHMERARIEHIDKLLYHLKWKIR